MRLVAAQRPPVMARDWRDDRIEQLERENAELDVGLRRGMATR
jgi:hypothetical protein